MSVGEDIRKARKAAGLTQQDLADKLGLSVMSIRRYETGARELKLDMVKRIAVALDVPPNELVNLNDIDDDFDLIVDTLGNAGYKIEQGLMVDEYDISYKDDDGQGVTLSYFDLYEIVHKVLADAETKKKMYIQKCLEAELLWPKGWTPK